MLLCPLIEEREFIAGFHIVAYEGWLPLMGE